MIEAQLAGLHLGVYRLHWMDGGSSVATISHNSEGRYWFAPSNWLHTIRDGVPSLPCYDWDKVRCVQVIETQDVGSNSAASHAAEIANAYGKMESCCECGEDYPRADLLCGEVFCPRCREKTK